MALTLDARAIYLDVRRKYAVDVSRTDILGIYLDILMIYSGMLSDNGIINIRQRCSR